MPILFPIVLICLLGSVAGQANYDLRLVGGVSDREGRVEIYCSGEWGTVCDDYWDRTDGDVACRQLGFPGALATYGSAPYGQGTGSILLDDVACTGSETSLNTCPNGGWGNHNCGHSEDAGVWCSAPTPTVRLADGHSDREGRVEIYYNGEWGTVCDDSWDTTDGGVVCRQLGYPGADLTFSQAHFGEGDGSILLDDVACAGSESSLEDCPSGGWGVNNCGHQEDAGVSCSRKIRLANGQSEREGRVEIYYNGAWGTVCDDSWDNTDGDVACRELGFPGAVEAYSSAHFGEGTGSILLDDVACAGTESSLEACDTRAFGTHNCGHHEDAGVECEKRVRLVDGGTDLQGRVEIYHNGAWGTVCDDGFGNSDADVACSELGYSGAEEDGVDCCATYGEGTESIWLDDLDCTGSETSLESCARSGWGIHNCRHSEDVGVRCTA